MQSRRGEGLDGVGDREIDVLPPSHQRRRRERLLQRPQLTNSGQFT